MSPLDPDYGEGHEASDAMPDSRALFEAGTAVDPPAPATTDEGRALFEAGFETPVVTGSNGDWTSFGYGARFLAIKSGDPDNPDIGDVLVRAAAEGWYESAAGLARFQAAVQATPWAMARTQAEESFEMLESVDPAEAQKRVDAKAAEIARVFKRLGLDGDDTIARIQEMARDAHVEGWTAYQMSQNVLAEADWASGQAGGVVGSNYRAINAKAADYMVGHLISDEERDGWAEDMYLGDIDQAWIDNHMANLASQTWVGMADRIKEGYTVKEIVSPIRAEASRWLERDITNRDFLDNPEFALMLNQSDGGGVMNVAQIGRYVRGMDAWQTTKNAKQSARKFADFVGTKFGATA